MDPFFFLSLARPQSSSRHWRILHGIAQGSDSSRLERSVRNRRGLLADGNVCLQRRRRWGHGAGCRGGRCGGSKGVGAAVLLRLSLALPSTSGGSGGARWRTRLRVRLCSRPPTARAALSAVADSIAASRGLVGSTASAQAPEPHAQWGRRTVRRICASSMRAAAASAREPQRVTTSGTCRLV